VSCPPASSECVDVVCNPDGTCGESPKPDTSAAAQTLGDCKRKVCKGGALVDENDDTDVPDDGNACTNEACNNGAVVTTSSPINTACGAGGALYCDGNGECVGCTAASQCTAPSNACMMATCVAGMCGTANKADGTGCNDNDACTQMDTCQAGACVAGNPVTCPFGGVCSAGACDNPIAYIKASNTGADDYFGTSVALSADGNTLAVGASAEDSNATGIDGNQADNSSVDSGAVYVFTRSGGAWLQEAYIKASNTDSGDFFGQSVALSADGSTLVVGAPREGSNATGIGGNQADNSSGWAGAVYVFTRSGGAWSQEAYIKASNTGVGDHFGISVALSGDGSTLGVGAPHERSIATGIGGNQADNSLSNAGAVYVFTRSGGAWLQEAYIKASNADWEDEFGISVALSGDGSTLAVGAWLERSNATGIGGDQADNSAIYAGAVYVFTRSGGAWSQEAYVKASNTGSSDVFGRRVALSGDGSRLAVGADEEDSNATGIGGNQADNSASGAGAVYVFTRSGGAWSQEAYIKASNTGSTDVFGTMVVVEGRVPGGHVVARRVARRRSRAATEGSMASVAALDTLLAQLEAMGRSARSGRTAQPSGRTPCSARALIVRIDLAALEGLGSRTRGDQRASLRRLILRRSARRFRADY
jgi:hypothetical protein